MCYGSGCKYEGYMGECGAKYTNEIIERIGYFTCGFVGWDEDEKEHKEKIEKQDNLIEYLKMLNNAKWGWKNGKVFKT